MIEGSKLVDAPPAGLTLDDVLPMAADYELAILHTSTPSFWSDVRTAEALKDSHPGLVIGFVGSHVTVLSEASLEASKGIDFVARGEFDYTIKEVAEGRPFEEIDGLSYRESGRIVHTKDRPVPVDMDALPHVTDVYKRDLRIEDYQVGEALYPYLSFYTGRGRRPSRGIASAFAAPSTWPRRCARASTTSPSSRSSSSTTTPSPTTRPTSRASRG
jgi:hypothetical protein